MQNLFKKYLDNQCSPAEVNELLQYFSAGENELLLRSLISEKLGFIDSEDDGSQWNQATENVYTAIKKQIDAEQTKVVPIFRRTWFRVAAAAVLLVGAFALYNIAGKNNSPKEEIVKTNIEKQDIAPGGNKAVLTLADGSQIILDSAANGNLASQGNTRILKLDNGQLVYNGSGSPPAGGDGGEVLYNTISTPRGGQYQLVLADGTKVWLNASSSLRFPASFTGGERKVELKGEGYFEVAKNTSMPFKVNVAGKEEVEVLGTHFNINSYVDETIINTTLLEGKVKVISVINSELKTQNSQLLSPGQQAQLTATGQIFINKSPAIDEVMAWKNGKFQFGESADIATIMRQIARWYDVEVEYKGTVTEHIGGTISRDVKVSKVLEMLEMTGSVKFQMSGRKVIVMPK